MHNVAGDETTLVLSSTYTGTAFVTLNRGTPNSVVFPQPDVTQRRCPWHGFIVFKLHSCNSRVHTGKVDWLVYWN